MTWLEAMGMWMLGGPWPIDAQNMAEVIDNAGCCSQVSGNPRPEPEQIDWIESPSSGG